MNRSMVRYLVSKLLLIEAGFLIIPLLVALIYKEPSQNLLAIVATIAILLLIGGLGILKKPLNHHIYSKEGLLIVALCWVLWSFFGALPFVFSGQIPSLIDAFFEMSSGFTTTGATILPDVEILSHAMHFWRSFAHLIGGMGVLVFALAIMNNSKNSHLEVMRAEVPGPVFGKIVSRLKDTAQILYIIYLSMAVIVGILLYLFGMPLFDSIVMAMGTAGTGGFAPYNDSVAHYDSTAITYTIAVATMLFGINFNLYFFILLGRIKTFFRDEELRVYLGIVALSTLLIFANIYQLYDSWSQAFTISFFQVTNTITTTGFGITDITKWPLITQYLILILMFLGGSAGSTAGGFKVIRAMVLAKIARNQTLATLYPRRIISLHINKDAIDKQTQHSILKYLSIYTISLLLLVGVITLDTNNFLVAVSAAASTFNNIGPILGTSESFAIFQPATKLILSFAMIAGRLEIYPMLLLFLPRTWSKH